MSIVRNIKVNLYKILTGYGFYVCIAFTLILCMTSTIYYDYSKAEEYSFFQVLIQFDEEFLLDDISLSAYKVMEKGMGTWLTMFIPIVAAFSFVPIVCDEYEAKSVRFMVFRTRKSVYYISKFLTACFCGGLATILGYALFIVVDFICFPGVQEYSADLREMLISDILVRHPIYAEKGMLGVVVEKMSYVFLYGTLYTVPATLLTSVIRNKYIVLCTPFFLKYSLSTLAIKLSEKIVSTGQMQIYSMCHPDALLSLYGEWEIKRYAIYYAVGLILISALIYLMLSRRRVDSGE